MGTTFWLNVIWALKTGRVCTGKSVYFTLHTNLSDVSFTPSRHHNLLSFRQMLWNIHPSRMFHISVVWRIRNLSLETDSVRFVHIDVRFYHTAWNISERERCGCFTAYTYESEEYKTVKAWNFHRMKVLFGYCKDGLWQGKWEFSN